jgi:hypothetical protein
MTEIIDKLQFKHLSNDVVQVASIIRLVSIL